MTLRPLAWIPVAISACLGGCSGREVPDGTSSLAAREAVRGPRSRRVHFEYAATVTGVPPGAKTVRVWIPLPESDACQTVTGLELRSPVPHRETREALYGNRIAYLEVQGPAPAEIPVKVSFDVERHEALEVRCATGGQLEARLLQGDRLAPVEGEAAARAAQVARSGEVAGARARAIYERVLDDVSYDKSGQGWGRGDLRYVCEAGKGNCSDFHALFIGMARAQRIPAFFEIGFPLPRDQREGTIGGYHCWAWYRDEGGAWRPVDASEADVDPSRKDYFFGTLCENRVALSRGRDLVLEPRQAGEPLNFFVYPYVEVDGQPLEKGIERRFTFRDLGS
ncbi:MAG: transglutaminase domain-containing protein [Planctomycetes bacterium]|nr:transglutaminase domain-containing protein [Planctomycetota bacterium]